MESAGEVRMAWERAEAWVRDLFHAAGVPVDDAARVAAVYARSALRGVGHHELDMVGQRLGWLADAGLNPRARLQIVVDQGAMVVLDADGALGELACSLATDLALERAANYGMALVSVRRSNHFLAAAPYVERIAATGALGLVWSNTDATMRYPGGNKAIMGNNPLGYGVPSEDGDWIYDACMAYTSLGNLRAYAAAGKPVPAHWGHDAQGRPSHNPADILDGGSISPMGDHKGFSLALFGEALTGLMAGGATGDQVMRIGGINTHNQTVLVIRPPRIPGEASFAARAADLGRRIRAEEPLARLPGEGSARRRAQALDEGVVLSPAVWTSLARWSERLGVPVPGPGIEA